MKTISVWKLLFSLSLVVLLPRETKTKLVQNPICNLPLHHGLCFGKIRSYYYNSTTETCQEFLYSGCFGNGNNFPSYEACKSACVPACALPPEVGPCRESFPSYFYDKEMRQCRRLNYGGCEGNANRFPNLQECAAACRCTAPRDQGPCTAIRHKFYFDEVTRTCQQFDYGGCQGNGNNFESLSECEQFCDPTTAALKEKERLIQEEQRRQKELENQRQELQKQQQQEELLLQLQQQHEQRLQQAQRQQHEQRQQAQRQQREQSFRPPDWQSPYPTNFRRSQEFESRLRIPSRSANDGAPLSARELQGVDSRAPDMRPRRNWQMGRELAEPGLQRERQPFFERRLSDRPFQQSDITLSQIGRHSSMASEPFLQPQSSRSSLLSSSLRERQLDRTTDRRSPSNARLFSDLRSSRQPSLPVPSQRGGPFETDLRSSRQPSLPAPSQRGGRFETDPIRPRERCRWTSSGRLCFTPVK